MLHIKHACDSGIQNVLVISENTYIIASLLAVLDLFNGQLFQKSETQIVKDF